MRISASVAIILVALVAILGLSMSSATVEQERLLSEFAAETRQQVHASAEALSRLDSVHQDIRMLADLVDGSRQNPALGSVTERRVLESTFHALAVVVVHYRMIALVNPNGAFDVLALRADRLITVGVMATEIAHEVGTPLAVVRGRAEQIMRDLGGGVGGDDLRVIIKQVDQISSTIRQLLDFSRRSPIDKRSVSLAVAVERTRELLQLKVEARRLQLSFDLAGDLPMLTAHQDQLQQVIVNLLLNACDASKPGDRIHLSARKAPSDMVIIEVLDHGSGIAAEHLEVAFDPFFTTKPRGEGTGLGLAIAAGIVRNHAGRIELHSTPGKGTTVTVLWPASPPHESEHA